MTRDKEKTTPFVKDKKPGSAGGASSAAKKPHVVPPMFKHYEAAKSVKLPRWAAPLLTGALVTHVIIFLTMWVKSIWDIEQLDRPKNTFDIAIAPPPPPPPPPPKGGAKPKDVTIVPKKLKVRDVVQPVHIDKQEVVAPVESGDPNGVEGGVEGGVQEGVLDSPAVAPPPPPPPPPPAPPANVPPTVLEQSRIAGEKNIVPDDVTKTEIQRSGKDRLTGTYKLCLTADGSIKSVQQMRSTGFPAYDSKIQNTIRGEWRYRSVMVNGKPVEACTAVTFIYSQK